MVGSIFINLDKDSIFSEKISVNLGYEDATYCIDINADVMDSFDEIISNKYYINNMLENLKFFIKYEVETFEYTKLLEYIEKQVANNRLFFDCKKIFITGEWNEVAFYIENNSFFKGKEIILTDVLNLDLETLKKIKSIFGKYSNIKVNVDGNHVPVTITDYEKTVISIEEIVNKIKVYNYSPFESLLYAYDLIRDRFYVHEDDNDDYSVSRDLTSVLLGNKIVCVGFANIYNVVASKLGIKSMLFFLIGNSSGHARNLMYLKDTKYGINGLYFFDPTFDCKHDDENNFLFSYRFFCRTKEEIDKFTENNYYYKSYEYLDDRYLDELVDSIPDGYLDVQDIVSFCKETKINHILELLGEEKITISSYRYTKNSLLKIIEKIIIKADREINVDTFIKALYVVRRNQYYENPTKYLFDIDVLTDILVNSKFYSIDTPEKRLLAAIGIKKKLGIKELRDKVNVFFEDNNLELDMERVKLVRTLKSYCNSKTEGDKKIL